MDKARINKDLLELIKYGNIGFYKYCEVVQIVLIDKETKNCYNFFTHVEMKSDREYEETKNPFITGKLMPINNRCNLAIKKYNLRIDEYLAIYSGCEESEVWSFKDDKVILSSKLSFDKKFIPETDPTSGQYNLYVPLSMALYGTNFIGNYYIHELFVEKSHIHNLCNGNDLNKVFEIIKQHKVIYNLKVLNDRIGNIVCKFNIEILEIRPLKYGAFRGIEIDVIFSEKYFKNRNITYTHIQEHDNIIMKNTIITYDDSFSIVIEPNQLKNMIYILDNNTGLTLFSVKHDYTSLTDYSSEITADLFSTSIAGERRVNSDKIVLRSIQPYGTIYDFSEMRMITDRQRYSSLCFNKEMGFFNAYKSNENSKAIKDLQRILENNILWDIEEVLIIDPYLTSKDILETVAYCPKYNLKIRAMTSYTTIRSNKETKNLSDASSLQNFKNSAIKQFNNALDKTTDISIEFRSVYKNYGYPFHDRFLILKYGVNRSRVWSLGTSVNSIGKQHHIIQKVDDPEAIVAVFEELWDKTEDEICLVYSNKTVV